jgi:hypothetical protein
VFNPTPVGRTVGDYQNKTSSKLNGLMKNVGNYQHKTTAKINRQERNH